MKSLFWLVPSFLLPGKHSLRCSYNYVIFMRIVYNETDLGYFKTFFPENLTAVFKTPYIATEKLLVFYDFDCFGYSLYFSIM